MNAPADIRALLERSLERFQQTDRLYRESLRDERLMNSLFTLSMSCIVGGLALTFMGVDWAQWLPIGGVISPFAEILYLSPRRQRRLTWFKKNMELDVAPRPAGRAEGGE